VGAKMPKTLEKTRKQIAKKRQNAIGALHRGSRDSRRLHKALVRDDRLEKMAAARRKQEQPYIDRVKHFQDIVRKNGRLTLSPEDIQDRIKDFVHKVREELDEVKKTRRPGRPPSTREDLLKMRAGALEKEYQDGFLIPDLASMQNISRLDSWEGPWSYLTTLSWTRVSASGVVRPSSFPPNGEN